MDLAHAIWKIKILKLWWRTSATSEEIQPQSEVLGTKAEDGQPENMGLPSWVLALKGLRTLSLDAQGQKTDVPVPQKSNHLFFGLSGPLLLDVHRD